MTQINNVYCYNGEILNGQKGSLRLTKTGEVDTVIDAVNLIAIPGLIDPHVHFRTPGSPAEEEKENWMTGAKAALAGGYTTVLDMPNNTPSCNTEEILHAKAALIRQQLEQVGLQDLHYGLYFGADKNQFDEIPKVANKICAIKVYMGSSTGNLLMKEREHLKKLFTIARDNNLLVAVHAEDEDMICANKETCKEKTFAAHSEIRNPEVAKRATQIALELTKEIGNRLYIVHVSTKEEIDLIRHAKNVDKLEVYAEATPHHLFLNTGHYHSLHGRAQVNPPLRDREHNKALLDAINEGVIDTIGSDHAPHTKNQKELPYGQCPSGLPGIETTLSLLLDARSKGLITLNKIIALTHTNPKRIFNLPDRPNDIVLVDLNKRVTVDESKLHTKCGWSPFAGWKLTGAPIVTVLEGRAYKVTGDDLSSIVTGNLISLAK